MKQLHCLTVPELKSFAQRHQLHTTGTKSQLRMRLSIWVRDEIAKGANDLGLVDNDDDDGNNGSTRTIGTSSDTIRNGMESDESNLNNTADDADSSEDDSTTSSSSDEELDVVGEKSETFALACSESQCVTTCSTESSAITSDNSDTDTVPSIHSMLRKLFGYSSFRDGQEWAIQRCLNGQRSLLVAPTGFGKSLCYTLPAAIMKGVCIVVSPLLSLIQDQMRVLPARLAAVTLSGPMSTASVAATLDDIVRGRIKLLFVSPERLTSSSFRRLFRARWNPETNQRERFFPVVSLLCVDEAHCMSQWAHNFRPSYMRLRSIIEMIEPRSVLAITATAGPRVVDDICRTLNIPRLSTPPAETINLEKTNGVRVSKTNRDNIDVKCLFLETQEERLSKVMLKRLNEN
jgi:superfamily II DNA helicase RecQ